jgi:hypothetical protein
VPAALSSLDPVKFSPKNSVIKGKVFPAHAMKARRGEEIKFNSFLIRK